MIHLTRRLTLLIAVMCLSTSVWSVPDNYFFQFTIDSPDTFSLHRTRDCGLNLPPKNPWTERGPTYINYGIHYRLADGCQIVIEVRRDDKTYLTITYPVKYETKCVAQEDLKNTYECVRKANHVVQIKIKKR